MSDRVLVEEVARLVGCEPPHLIEKYRGRIDHESDCGRRAMMLWSDARKECDEAESRAKRGVAVVVELSVPARRATPCVRTRGDGRRTSHLSGPRVHGPPT